MSNKKKVFVNLPRETYTPRPVKERVQDYREIYLAPGDVHLSRQSDRCMDCGIPFCQYCGCPVTNVIPEFNDAVSEGRWQEACELLHSMCNFPEFTGRLCPAPCEAACTLSVNFEPVTIREIEWAIVERGFAEGYIRPRPPATRTDKRVAVIGSGPAGLVVAQNVNRAGHRVTVFEADDRIGGFLRYGVPDFKMEKHVIDRRVDLLKAEGIAFETGVLVGEDVSARYLQSKYDAVCLCNGSRHPRDLTIPGRDLKGIHFAMEYLEQSNRRQAGDVIAPESAIDARDKVVLVLGGGDTGSDCVGTANRQGAAAVHQFELLPCPPEGRNADMPWPTFPRLLRSSSSHKEGCQRRWSINTQAFDGVDGRLTAVTGCEVDWSQDDQGRWSMKDRPGTAFTMPVDLVFLALGFVHPVHGALLGDLGVELDKRGNVAIDAAGMTSVPGVFASGDVTRGATLIVTAMSVAKTVAAQINQYLAR